MLGFFFTFPPKAGFFFWDNFFSNLLLCCKITVGGGPATSSILGPSYQSILRRTPHPPTDQTLVCNPIWHLTPGLTFDIWYLTFSHLTSQVWGHGWGKAFSIACLCRRQSTRDGGLCHPGLRTMVCVCVGGPFSIYFLGHPPSLFSGGPPTVRKHANSIFFYFFWKKSMKNK